MDETANFIRYSKHTPKILRQQIICDLLKRYVTADDGKESPSDKGVMPDVLSSVNKSSIQRFHGALLFVDISGFTVLSQKLDVESLKNHINDYFTKMLSIVDKWGGDVVKFAGDALYILWPTNFRMLKNKQGNVSVRTQALSDHEKFSKAARLALEKAVACGLEISTACSRYEIRLNAGGKPETPHGGILGRFFNFPAKVAPSSPVAGSDEDVLYLDVHSGVSAGLMAGIDISHLNRSEFFLIGEPLVGVAMAESQASKGGVVMCPMSHDLLHGDELLDKADPDLTDDEDDRVCVESSTKQSHVHSMKCGCGRTANGLFQVSTMNTTIVNPVPNVGLRRSRSKNKLIELDTRSELNEQSMKLYDDIQNDLERIMTAAQSVFKKEFVDYLRASADFEKEPLLVNTSPKVDKSDKRSGMTQNTREEEKTYALFFRDYLRKHFMDWMQSSLSDAGAKHVHEVERKSFTFMSAPLKQLKAKKDVSVYANLLAESMKEIKKRLVSMSPLTLKAHSEASLADPIGKQDELDLQVQPKVSFKKGSEKDDKQQTSRIDDIGDGELRTVIVVFVKVDFLEMQLFSDPEKYTLSSERKSDSRFMYNDFSFLNRTTAELASDEELLARFQSCFEVLCASIMDNGGQLRQFIVDDKGTVCIGTFGLRGSASADNAASALQAAKAIVEGLKDLDLCAYIGLTSGKAYCGLVGSAMRHEYAVMGPSTNLSARLMCKAPQNGIICDADTVERDRRHIYIALAEVQAKGYTKPVMTYKPSGEEASSSHHMALNSRSMSMSRMASHRLLGDLDSSSSPMTAKISAAQKLQALLKTDFVISDAKLQLQKIKLHGRDDELQIVFSFLFRNDHNNVTILAYNQPSRLLAVCAPTGVGKSAFLVAIDRKLISVSKSDAKLNLVSQLYRTSAANRDAPFSAWKSLLPKLLRTFFRNSSNSKTSTRMAKFDSVRRSVDYQAIVDNVWPLMPEELQDQQDALQFLLPGLSAEPAQVANEAEFQTCVKVAAALIHLLPAIMKKLIVIIIEDANLLDLWSMQVVYRLWSNHTGIALLLSFSTSDDQSSVTWGHGVSTRSTPIQQELESYNPHVSGDDFFLKFAKEDSERFRTLPLGPLGEDASLAIAKEFIGADKQSSRSEQELYDIYEASGGKPLYIVEMIRSAVGSSGKVESLTDTLNANPSHRVEEAVFYRLDRLHFSLQLLLKACAIASSYGGKVTLHLISFLLVNSPSFSESGKSVEKFPLKDVAQSERTSQVYSVRSALFELLRTEEFLAIRSSLQPNTSLVSDKSTLRADLLDGYLFEFLIPLEQCIISGMVIDEQKEYYHERAALYRHVENQKFWPDIQQHFTWHSMNNIQQFLHPDVSVVQKVVIALHEEAFHWERSSLWSRAMRAYYECAVLLKVLPGRICSTKQFSCSYTDALGLALLMYHNLESEGERSLSFPDLDSEQLDDIFHFLLDEEVQYKNIIFNGPTLNRHMSDVQEVVLPDPPSIYVVVHLHLMLSELSLQSWQDVNTAVHYIQVCLLGCIYCRLHQRELEEGVKSSTSIDATYIAMTSCIGSLHYLQVLTFCSHISYMYYPEVTNFQLRYSPHHLEFFTGRRHAKSSHAEEVDSALALQAQILIALFDMHNNRANKANRQVTVVQSAYSKDVPIYSALLISFFSADIVPYVMALNIQYDLLMGSLEQSKTNWSSNFQYLQSMLGRHTTQNIEYSFFLGIVCMLASMLHIYGGLADMCSLVTLYKNDIINARQSTSSPYEVAISSAGLDRYFVQLMLLRIELLEHTYSYSNTQFPLASTEAKQRFSAIYNDVSRLDPLVNQEINRQKMTFLSTSGLLLSHIYVEVYSILYAYCPDHRSTLDLRILASLMPLVNLPVEPCTSCYFNLIHALSYLVHYAKDCSGGVFFAVKERANQVIHTALLRMSQNRYNLAEFLLSRVLLMLPLHCSIVDQYQKCMQGSAAKLAKQAVVKQGSNAAAQDVSLKQPIGITSPAAVPSSVSGKEVNSEIGLVCYSIVTHVLPPLQNVTKPALFLNMD